jgi:hypothetical protein
MFDDGSGAGDARRFLARTGLEFPLQRGGFAPGPRAGREHDVLMPADAADQPVSVRSQVLDGRLKVVDLERDTAQTKLVRPSPRRA